MVCIFGVTLTKLGKRNFNSYPLIYNEYWEFIDEYKGTNYWFELQMYILFVSKMS